jgi:DNA-binding transcriptional LysR family regulator
MVQNQVKPIFVNWDFNRIDIWTTTLPRHFDIDLLRTFVVIAETRAMNKAALRVSLTQAAVSMQVRRLEDMAGQPLLNRTGRGVTLTLHGERFLAHARKILRAHDEAMAELSGAGLSGTIRFGCPDDYAAVFLPHILRGFAVQHPQVLVEVFCASTPRLLEKLKDHALDLALISLPEKAGPEGVIRRERLVWVGAPGAGAAAFEPLRLALSDPDTLDHRAARSALEAAGIPFRVAFASGSVAGLTAVVRSGQAIAVLTETAVPDDLEILPAASGLPVLPSVGIALRLDRDTAAPAVQAFAGHIEALLPLL